MAAACCNGTSCSRARARRVYPSIGLGFGSFNFGRSSGSGVGLGTGLGVGPVGGAPLGCSVVFATQGGTVQSFTRNGPGCVA